MKISKNQNNRAVRSHKEMMPWRRFVSFCLMSVLIQFGSAENSWADSKDAEALVDESKTLIGQRRFAQAERVLKHAIKLNPGIAEAHHNLGLVYARLGRNSRALSAFQTAIKLNDSMSQSLLMLASLQQASGDLDAAIASYDQFLLRFPNNKSIDRIKGLRDGLKIEQGKISQGQYFDKAKWLGSRMPLTVFIGSIDLEAHANFDSVIRKAFRTWESDAHKLIKFSFVTNPTDADIECRWVKNMSAFENSGEAGQCEFYFNNRNELRSLIKFQANPISQDALPLDASRLERIALHEIGHSLGLVGHSNNPEDIMFYSTVVNRKSGPSKKDLERLRRLYWHK